MSHGGFVGVVLLVVAFRGRPLLAFLAPIDIALERPRVDDKVKEFQDGESTGPQEQGQGPADITYEKK